MGDVAKWVDEKYGPKFGVREGMSTTIEQLLWMREALIEAVEIMKAAKEVAEEYKDQDASVQVEGLWMTHNILEQFLEGLDDNT